MNTFKSFADFIDARDERRENVIKVSRDITKSSKKVIFALHRVGKAENKEKALSQAETLMKRVRRLFRDIAVQMKEPLDKYRLHKSVSGCVQEYIEAESFLYYLCHKDLVPLNILQGYIDASIGAGVEFSLRASDFVLGIADLS